MSGHNHISAMTPCWPRAPRDGRMVTRQHLSDCSWERGDRPHLQFQCPDQASAGLSGGGGRASGGSASVLNEEQVFVSQTRLPCNLLGRESPAFQSARLPFMDGSFLLSLCEQDTHTEINFHCAHLSSAELWSSPSGNGSRVWPAIKTTNAFSFHRNRNSFAEGKLRNEPSAVFRTKRKNSQDQSRG